MNLARRLEGNAGLVIQPLKMHLRILVETDGFDSSHLATYRPKYIMWQAGSAMMILPPRDYSFIFGAIQGIIAQVNYFFRQRYDSAWEERRKAEVSFQISWGTTRIGSQVFFYLDFRGKKEKSEYFVFILLSINMIWETPPSFKNFMHIHLLESMFSSPYHHKSQHYPTILVLLTKSTLFQ